MTYELCNADDILVIKTLEELNLDLRRADFTNLMLLSADLLAVIVTHFLNSNNTIRELASRAMVYITNNINDLINKVFILFLIYRLKFAIPN